MVSNKVLFSLIFTAIICWSTTISAQTKEDKFPKTKLDKVSVDSSTYIMLFRYRGEDSGYIVKDSTIIGYLSKRKGNQALRLDMPIHNRLGVRKNFSNTYYHVYDRGNKLLAFVVKSRSTEKKCSLQVAFWNSDQVRNIYEVDCDRALELSTKLLMGENKLW